MNARRALGGWGLVVWIAIAPMHALAQQGERPLSDQEARSLFEAGRLAFEQQRYEDAYARFAEAYRLSGRADLLFNMGSAADRLRHDEQAIDHYDQYLRDVPAAENRVEVERRIAVLRSARETSPEEPAVVATDIAVAPSMPDAPATDRGAPIWEEWWLWTIVGVVVVGAAVGIGAGVAASSQPGVQPGMTGDVGPGGVVLTLSVPMD